MKPLVSSILILLTAPFAFAQSPRISDQIVVTASQLPETIESTPASVTVITRKEIEDRADRDITEALREVPGLTVSRTGSFGKTASVFLRGSSSKQVLVLWNGVEINDPYFSGYNWGQFSTVGVERIEVVRGPFSSLYGADAVGGVVNIITTGRRDSATVDIAAGGHGLMNAALAATQTAGAAILNLTIEHRQDNGFAPNDNSRQNTILGGITFLPKDTLSIGLLGRFANYDLGVPHGSNDLATAFIPTPHHREDGKEWQVAVPLRAEFGKVQTEVRVSENHRDDNYVDPDSSSFGFTTSRRRSAHAVVRADTVVGKVVAGAEGERSDVANTSSFGLSFVSRRRSSNAVFVEDRVSLAAPAGARVEIAAGVRRDYFDTFGSEISPRLAAAWIKNGHKLRVAYGQAFRAPYIGELYLPFLGNPDLKAERSKSIEAGYDYFFAANGSVSATLFRGDHRNLIVYDLAVNHFANIGRARTAGVEISASDRRGPVSASISYTYLKATDEPSGAPLLRRPKNSGSAAVGYSLGTGSAQLVVARVGTRPDVTDLFPFGRVTNRAYTVADLTLRWNLGGTTPYLKLENLTNTKYEEVFGYPSPSRRAVVGVRYTIDR